MFISDEQANVDRGSTKAADDGEDCTIMDIEHSTDESPGNAHTGLDGGNEYTILGFLDISDGVERPRQRRAYQRWRSGRRGRERRRCQRRRRALRLQRVCHDDSIHFDSGIGP